MANSLPARSASFTMADAMLAAITTKPEGEKTEGQSGRYAGTAAPSLRRVRMDSCICRFVFSYKNPPIVCHKGYTAPSCRRASRRGRKR